MLNQSAVLDKVCWEAQFTERSKEGSRGVSRRAEGGEEDLQKVRGKGNVSQRTYCLSEVVEVGQGLSKDAMLPRAGGFWS